VGAGKASRGRAFAFDWTHLQLTTPHKLGEVWAKCSDAQAPPASTPHITALVTSIHPLQVKLRGYFLPPRPHKSAVEGQLMADAFVEERRVALQQYLEQLVQLQAVLRTEVGGRLLPCRPCMCRS